MSLNKTLDRLFDEIRREAKRNPGFADRLDAVLRLHDSRRDVRDETIEEVAAPPPADRGGNDAAEAEGAPGAARAKRRGASIGQSGARLHSAPPSGEALAPTLNPAGLYKRAGEDALTEALVALDHTALRALVEEHNLDPAGATAEMDSAELVAHIVAQAKKRAERDDKMFDY
jgi:hypothetical protein